MMCLYCLFIRMFTSQGMRGMMSPSCSLVFPCVPLVPPLSIPLLPTASFPIVFPLMPPQMNDESNESQ